MPATVYLHMRMDEPGGNTKLVVIDAAGPRENTIYAVTVEAVLTAHETGKTRMTAEYALVIDRKATSISRCMRGE